MIQGGGKLARKDGPILRHKVGRALTNVAMLRLTFLVGVVVRASMVWLWLG